MSVQQGIFNFAVKETVYTFMGGQPVYMAKSECRLAIPCSCLLRLQVASFFARQTNLSFFLSVEHHTTAAVKLQWHPIFFFPRPALSYVILFDRMHLLVGLPEDVGFVS
ncbi:unnamed protein product [Ixodes pacificus]